MDSVAAGWKFALEANQALTAAFKVRFRKWNEVLHPRGADGRFISKGGWVKWIDPKTKQWASGSVDEVYTKNGPTPDKSVVIIRTKLSNGNSGPSLTPDKIYSSKAPVAKISTDFTAKLVKKTGPQGSNPGGLFQDPVSDDKYYVKYPKSESHAINELLGHRLYEAVGSAIPEVSLSSDNKTFSSKIEDSIAWGEVSGPDRDAVLNEIRKNFVVDAWLANWDAPITDNIRVTKDGVPLRVDTGGALDYRAMGASKVANLTPEIKELKTLRDPAINSSGAKLFGPTTDEQMMDGVRRILALSPSAIEDIVNEEGGPKRLAKDLIARRAWLATHFGMTLPESTPSGKKILDDYAEDIKTAGSDLGVPSLAPAIKKLAKGEKPAILENSPVWLKKKKEHGDGLPDIWTVSQVNEDGTFNLVSSKNHKLENITSASLEALRDNHTSYNATYSDGSAPSLSDEVITPEGDSAKILEFFPKYAKIQVATADGPPKNKVIHINKLTPKPKQVAEDSDSNDLIDVVEPAPTARPAKKVAAKKTPAKKVSPKKMAAKKAAAKKLAAKKISTESLHAVKESDLYKGKDVDIDMQWKYRHIASAMIENSDLSVKSKIFKASELIPTQSTTKSAISTGSGPTGMLPIVVRKNSKDYLLDGHHRFIADEEPMLTHFIDMDAVATSNPSYRWIGHDWDNDPQPAITYKMDETDFYGYVMFYSPGAPYAVVHSEEHGTMYQQLEELTPQ